MLAKMLVMMTGAAAHVVGRRVAARASVMTAATTSSPQHFLGASARRGGAVRMMALKTGIVGLPNVGKSTLFNALMEETQAQAANFPFCTIEPNVGIVGVPDPRLKVLADINSSVKTVPTTLSFVDIAGLVAGASKGEGLGNQFLANIRECDAIVHVVRCFEDDNIIHVDGSVNPTRDIEVRGRARGAHGEAAPEGRTQAPCEARRPLARRPPPAAPSRISHTQPRVATPTAASCTHLRTRPHTESRAHTPPQVISLELVLADLTQVERRLERVRACAGVRARVRAYPCVHVRMRACTCVCPPRGL